MTSEVDTYTRDHVIKVCRERCIDEGLYGRALEACIEECAKNIRGASYAERKG